MSAHYPQAFFIAIASVRRSRYLLLNHWTKSNQIWCVSCSNEWGAQRHNFVLPHPLGPWGGAKRSNIKFQLLSQFQIFLNQTLCVFSQMKDIKHIRGNFHSVTWVMPQGWDLRGYRGVGDVIKKKKIPKFNKFVVRVTHMNGTCNGTMFWSPPPGALGRDQKVKFNYNY